MLLVANMLNNFINAQVVYLLLAIYLSDYGRPRIFSESCLLPRLDKARKHSSPRRFLGEKPCFVR
jgi:hypothetical protein